jgi:hypothetical protein
MSDSLTKASRLPGQTKNRQLESALLTPSPNLLRARLKIKQIACVGVPNDCDLPELPENCYDLGWLDSLNDWERKILNMQLPLDMTFSEDE